MTNKEFIKAYIKGVKRSAVNGHCGFYKGYFINYSTVLCKVDRKTKTAEFNSRKYSNTTGRIQSILLAELTAAGYRVTKYSGSPARAWNYGYQGARNLKRDDLIRCVPADAFI